MKWLNDSKISIVLFVFMAAIVLGGGSARAELTFGQPVNLGPIVNRSANDEGPSISADGLNLYFNSDRTGGYGNFDLWMTTRSTKDGPWGEPENLGPKVNSSAREHMGSISADGLTLYFTSTLSGGWDLWVTTRVTKDNPWSTPVNLGPPVNSLANEFGPGISADGLSLYFGSSRAGGYGVDDIWVSTRATTDGPWQEPVNLGPTVNSPAWEMCPRISTDGRMLFFSDSADVPFRPGGNGGGDLWVTTRATISDPWGTPVNLGPTVNSSAFDGAPSISADGSTLYFMSGGSGAWDLWQAPIILVVDFNGDKIVDLKDFSKLAQYWGQDESSVDIAPPFGDGIVDFHDLAVFAEYWMFDFSLLAHWKLDETEGTIAHNSISSKHGNLNGGPIWQPTGGAIDGALQLDGTNDYVSTPFILNPSSGAFTAMAWVKGGSPGQVVVSQQSSFLLPQGKDWLCADPTAGKLMTFLTDGSPSTTPLICEFVINDGNWHCIAVTWDGSRRRLYADGTKVAEDSGSLANLVSSNTGLNLGAGKTLTVGTFWSGLIDDVRIYNREVTP